MISGLDRSCIGGRTLILDLFHLLRSSLCICVVCKFICVVSKVLVCCFYCKGAFSREFLSRWICNRGFMKFSLLCVFSFYTFADVVVAPWSTICFRCDVVSGCIFVWIRDWFVKILLDVLKLSWHFGDCSLIFLLIVDLDCRFLDKVVIALRQSALW